MLYEKSNALDWKPIFYSVGESKSLIFLVLLATFFNWLIESIKWKNLIAHSVLISYRKALQAVMSGLLFSLFTPRRIGDIGARAWYVPSEKRKEAIYYSSFSAAAQMQVTLLAGLFCLPFFYALLPNLIELPVFLLYSIAYGLGLLSIYLYFKSNVLLRLIHLFSKRWNQNEIPIISFQKRTEALALSFLRYIIFLIQFYILISIFDSSISFYSSSIGIAFVFFISAFIPTGILSDLLLRSTLAYLVFPFLGSSAEAGLSASLLLWICNIFIPATITALGLSKKLLNT